MSHLLNSTTEISLRAKKLRADEIEVYDPVTNEFVPIVPGGGGGENEVPPYAQPTLIDFGEKRMKINQSHLEVGDVGSAMRKTEVKASGLDVTDDAGNNAKIEGGAIYYKKASLEGEEENPTVTMPYEDIGEVVDKIKPIRDYLKENSIEVTSAINAAAIAPSIISVANSANPSSAVNRSRMIPSSYRIVGSTQTDYTEYGNGYITKNANNNLNLEDIINSQKNYLKPDKIEFANGSGLSSAGLSYKIGDVTYTKTIREIAEMTQPYLRETGIDFRPPGDNDSMHITNIHGSTVGTNTLALATPYTDPEYENAYHQAFIDALQFQYTDPETGLISVDNKDIINVTNKFKDVTATASDIDSVTNKFKGVTGTIGNINAVISKFATAATSSLTAPAINTMLNKLSGIESTAAQIDAAVANSGGGTTYPYLKPTRIELSANDEPYPLEVTKSGSTTYSRMSNEYVEVVRNNGYSSDLQATFLRFFKQNGGGIRYTYDEIAYKHSPTDPEKYASVSDIIDVANEFKNVSGDYVYPMKTYDILFNGSTTAKSGYTTCGPAAEGVTALYPMMNIMALYAFQSMNNDIAFNFEGRVMLSGNYAFTGTDGVNKQRTYSFEVTVPGVHLPKFTLDQIILGDDVDNSSSENGRVYQNLMVRHVNMPTFQRFEGITNSVWKFSFQIYNSSSSNVSVGHMLMRFRLILHIKERLDGSDMIEV